MAVYRVDLLTDDPDAVFDWIRENVPEALVARKAAQRLGNQWSVTTAFKRAEDAEAFQRRWQPQAEGQPVVPSESSALPLRGGRRPAPPQRPSSGRTGRSPELAAIEMTRADRRLLDEITSFPWPGNTSLPVEGPMEMATVEQLSDLLNSYLPLEQQLKAAAELGRREVAEGRYRSIAAFYPGMSDEQLRNRTLDASLADGQWGLAGIARRFLEDDPAELARFAAISVRAEWILVGHGREGCHGEGHTALWALAVGDERVLNRILTTLPYPLDDDRGFSHPPYYLELYNAVFGALRGDRKTVRHSVEQLQSHKLHAHEAGLVTCLGGIIEESAETVAQGLAALGRAIRRIRAIAPHHKLLDVTLHGGYELCRRVDPTLIRLWDPAQGLPWDAALYEWRRAGRDPLEGVDFTGLPERHRILLTELPEPDWWPAVGAETC